MKFPFYRFTRPVSSAAVANTTEKAIKSAGFAAGDSGGWQSYMTQPGKPVWMERAYAPFALEGYARNVVAYACVEMLASAVSHVGWKLHRVLRDGTKREIQQHALLALIDRPNPFQGGVEWMHQLVAQLLIGGNAYAQMVQPRDGVPQEIYALRPDRVRVIAGKAGLPAGYRYQTGPHAQDYMIDSAEGRCAILHLRLFHPLNDWYGLSPMEAASFSIDQHNQAAAWNQALLQNGARPSGALVVRNGDGSGPGSLSDDQFHRLRHQIDDQFSGPAKAGRPLLLEGGLDWKEMSHSPRDMDFIDAKHSAARDIALAFGVPPQLLGIPGDNTYANLAEARLAMWEQTVLPLLDRVTDALNGWLVPAFGESITLSYDADGIQALTLRRDKLWERIGAASFLSDEEKRTLLGLGAKAS